MYVTFPIVMILGLGNVVSETAISLILFILFEHPFKTVFNVLGLRNYQNQTGLLDQKYYPLEQLESVEMGVDFKNGDDTWKA